MKSPIRRLNAFRSSALARLSAPRGSWSANEKSASTNMPAYAKLGGIAAVGIVAVALLTAGSYSWMNNAPEPVDNAAAAANPVPDEQAAAEKVAALETEIEGAEPQEASAADTAEEVLSTASEKLDAERPAAVLGSFEQQPSAGMQQPSAGMTDSGFDFPDSQRTSSIRPDRPASTDDSPATVDGVEIAETDAEILALEEVQQRENEVALAGLRLDDAPDSEVISDALDSDALDEETAVDEDVAETEIAQVPASQMLPAIVTDYVNLRDGPGDDANVVTIVPKDTSVQASQDCPLQWCQVVYDGQRGYIFQGYVSKSQPTEQTAAQP